MKRVAILAAALAAVTALAVPTAASATWKHGHVNPIQQNVQIGFTGTNVKFQSGIGGVECQTTSSVQFLAGQTTANIDTFVPHPTDATTNCKGTGGLAFCQIHNVQPTNTPWVLHTIPDTTEVEITSGDIHSTPTGGFCPIEWITVTPTDTVHKITGKSQTHTVSTLELSGEVVVHVQTKGQPNQSSPHPRNGPPDALTTTVSGLLHVEEPNVNTYSI
ncbi:MAG TPA: hypothetical protein VFY48_02910 [Solirubrobacterales bacterium]|nr:hypothetical protein [Solirubrobacterales bacterium]